MLCLLITSLPPNFQYKYFTAKLPPVPSTSCCTTHPLPLTASHDCPSGQWFHSQIPGFHPQSDTQTVYERWTTHPCPLPFPESANTSGIPPSHPAPPMAHPAPAIGNSYKAPWQWQFSVPLPEIYLWECFLHPNLIIGQSWCYILTQCKWKQCKILEYNRKKLSIFLHITFTSAFNRNCSSNDSLFWYFCRYSLMLSLASCGFSGTNRQISSLSLHRSNSSPNATVSKYSALIPIRCMSISPMILLHPIRPSSRFCNAALLKSPWDNLIWEIPLPIRSFFSIWLHSFSYTCTVFAVHHSDHSCTFSGRFPVCHSSAIPLFSSFVIFFPFNFFRWSQYHKTHQNNRIAYHCLIGHGWWIIIIHDTKTGQNAMHPIRFWQFPFFIFIIQDSWEKMKGAEGNLFVSIYVESLPQSSTTPA